MSRIEKAIEIAARQRNTAITGQENVEATSAPALNSAVKSPPIDQSDGESSRSAASKRARQLEKPLQLDAIPTFANHCLVMATAPNSASAEQYRKLKSSILKQFEKGEEKRSFMVTSSMAGEGKSVTALNLAISLAQEYDHTVLLVDADLRKPSLLQYLGLHAEQGLSDCVLDGVKVDSVLVNTWIDGLSVLPAGRSVINPVEIFSSKRMQEVTEEIYGSNPERIVIFDTTPLLPFAEPQYLAGIVDGIILVVREHLTSIDKLKQSLEMMKNHHLLGVVCNGVSRVASTDGYYGYYGYKY
jgi:exopolysaccharide/PEP-CTERM locus tyrosine autokinase